MADIKFTREHEWVRIDGDTGVVGITEHAQEQLGDLVFVELPEIGRILDQGDEAGCRRIGQGGQRDLFAGRAARSSASTRRWATIPRWSIPTRWVKAGSTPSSCRIPANWTG